MDHVEAPWGAVLDLAWLSFLDQTIGVGAVVTDPTGAVVATGRNAIVGNGSERLAVTGSTLAHAEVNAIATLGPTRSETRLVLWSSLQPCLLCVAACILGGIDEVRYLAPDPLWVGIERLPDINGFVASRWPSQILVEGEPLTSFAWTLAVHDLIQNRRETSVAVGAADALRPDLMGVADQAVAAGDLERARANRTDWRDAIESSVPWGAG